MSFPLADDDSLAYDEITDMLGGLSCCGRPHCLLLRYREIISLGSPRLRLFRRPAHSNRLVITSTIENTLLLA